MNKILLPRTSWFLFLLIPLTFIGFFPSYFSKLFVPMPALFHIHTFFMTTWMAMAIAQPLLIRQRKLAWHKRIGVVSYIVMPVVVITIYLMIRHSYNDEFARLGSTAIREKYNLSDAEIHQYAAAHEIKALVAFLWLITFYTMAIINRKKVVAHATYMFAATLVLLGPALDRIIFPLFRGFKLPVAGLAEYFTFGLVTLVLLSLSWYQKKNNYPLTPVITTLAIHLFGIAVYTLMPETLAWRSFVELLL